MWDRFISAVISSEEKRIKEDSLNAKLDRIGRERQAKRAEQYRKWEIRDSIYMAKAKQRADDSVQFLPLSGTQSLGDQHLTRIGEAKADHGGKINDQRGLRHGRKPERADKLAHDHHIYSTVKHLHGIGRHKRQRKE